MKIENVVVISLEDYEEYQQLKKKEKSIEIKGCLVYGCDEFNYNDCFKNTDFTDYELVAKDYGGLDVFKAKDKFGEDIIFFGTWNK